MFQLLPFQMQINKAFMQVLLLNNERFLVPELVFSPSDIGLPQAGLPQMVADAALKAHPDLWPLLLSNVVLCGGMATCPGFHERLLQDLQPLVPDTITVRLLCGCLR